MVTPAPHPILVDIPSGFDERSLAVGHADAPSWSSRDLRESGDFLTGVTPLLGVPKGLPSLPFLPAHLPSPCCLHLWSLGSSVSSTGLGSVCVGEGPGLRLRGGESRGCGVALNDPQEDL